MPDAPCAKLAEVAEQIARNLEAIAEQQTRPRQPGAVPVRLDVVLREFAFQLREALASGREEGL